MSKKESILYKVQNLFPRDALFGLEDQSPVELNYNICMTIAYVGQEIANAIRGVKDV